jgi:membrane-associated phospholipid phosphatase
VIGCLSEAGSPRLDADPALAPPSLLPVSPSSGTMTSPGASSFSDAIVPASMRCGDSDWFSSSSGTTSGMESCLARLAATASTTDRASRRWIIGTTVYFQTPVGYSGPITPAVTNSFPSHHALLAAAIVALVFLARPWLALPFAAVSGIIDIALVQDHDHHVVDVAGSTAFVALATGVALLVVPALVRWLNPSLPALSEVMQPATTNDIDTTIQDLREEMHRVSKGQAERDAAILAELARLRDVLEQEFIAREGGGTEGVRAPTGLSVSAYGARQGRHRVDEQQGTEEEK